MRVLGRSRVECRGRKYVSVNRRGVPGVCADASLTGRRWVHDPTPHCACLDHEVAIKPSSAQGAQP